ncbi:MAG: hypothetical protein RL254_1669 [Planctomycetota bacterium]|jgi:hypothetical protein
MRTLTNIAIACIAIACIAITVSAVALPACAQRRPVQPESELLAERASTTIALRHLYSMAEVNQLRGDGDIEVRWMAIPDSWKAPTEGIFQEATMRSLSDLGMKIGADPASWQTEAL